MNWTGVQRRRAVAESRIRMMEGYASRKRCRRAALLEWFGEEIPACSGCDACADAGKRGRWFSPWNRLLR